MAHDFQNPRTRKYSNLRIFIRNIELVLKKSFLFLFIIVNFFFHNNKKKSIDIESYNKKDNRFAKNVGIYAAKLLLANKKSYLIGLSSEKKIIPISFSDCKKYSRKMPDRFIKSGSFDVSNDYIKYLNKVMK